jgi:hypothetical protein
MARSKATQEYDAWIATIPWVHPVTGDVPCMGIKQGQVGVKHLRSVGGRPPEGIPDRARCKRRAKWHFTALISSESTTGSYCRTHLGSQIDDQGKESARFRKWYEKNPRPNYPSEPVT